MILYNDDDPKLCSLVVSEKKEEQMHATNAWDASLVP